MTGKPPRRPPARPWPIGNLGLGLCFSCITDYWREQQHRGSAEGTNQAGTEFRPRYAVTMAPSPKSIPGPDGAIVGMMIVTLPTCYEHLSFSQPGNGQPRRRFLVAGQQD